MPIVITRKQLAQRLPSSTDACLLYKCPDANTTTYINTLIVCNTTGLAKTYSIWVNQNASTSGDQFALIKDRPLSANASDQIIYPEDGAILLSGSNASILCKASVANAVTFTIYGQEVVET